MTNQDYQVALKVFGRRVNDENGSDPPDALERDPARTGCEIGVNTRSPMT